MLNKIATNPNIPQNSTSKRLYSSSDFSAMDEEEEQGKEEKEDGKERRKNGGEISPTLWIRHCAVGIYYLNTIVLKKATTLVERV